MATHAAFLRSTGIDYTLTQGADKKIGVDPAHFNPNAAYGKVYWVDKVTGSDLSSGLSPAQAFATVAKAIAVSNAEVGSYDMNTIYVNSNTYSEALTTFPKQCHMVAIGARARLTGAHTVTTGAANCHFWNFWFRGSGAYPLVTIPTTTYGGGFHNCQFEGTVSATYGISLGSTNDFIIENCIFQGNPLHPVAIDITALQLRLRIINNWIGATTTGIQTFNGTGDYGNLIANNIISRQATDPNSSAQMAYGIKMLKTTGTSKYLIVDNRIEAVDAIYSATSDTAFQNQAIGNFIVEAGTGASEDDFTG